MPIQVLPPDVAAQIAAGEVIERPASVVKELIENAIDAGASEIKVEVRDGGKRLVRVVDNGCGIPAAEVEMAFERHATSKLRSVDDLFAIRSLGFRGEALPSIAAVAQVTLVSRTADEPAGALIRLEGGRVMRRDRRGAPPGTVVTVENLFYNTPARLKFLKTDATEAGHIHDLVTRYAMAFPALRFQLVSDGRLIFQSLGTGYLLDVLIKVYGLEVARQLLEVQGSRFQVEGSDGPQPLTCNLQLATAVAVSGYVSPPSVSRGSRKDMTFLVNHRWVQDRALGVAVVEAYRNLLMVGRHPLAVLNLELDPALVDVNVHPAKAEVRFRDPNAVFSAVQKAVRRAVVDQAPVPSLGLGGAGTGWPRPPHLAIPGRPVPADTQLALELHRPSPPPPLPGGEGGPPPPGGQPPAAGRLPILRVIGQLGQTYILAEGPEGLYLIDQHAAHERVLYEQLQAGRARSQPASQALLEPVLVELAPDQEAVLSDQGETLTGLGFAVEPFGNGVVLLRAVPSILRAVDLRQVLLAILDEAAEGGEPLAKDREARLIASVCRQAAIKAGQTLSQAEMQELVRQLEASSAPRTCPHGRPTMIHLSATMLEREFGRK
jgi:DNA mismatch repair protein MutL